jgi:flagellar hook assembly protein FlgD
VDAAFGAFGFGPPFPNPTRAGANFQFVLTAEDLTRSTRVEIQIHSVTGKLVTTLPGQSVVGVQNLFWDGRIDNGREAPDGIYYVNLIAGDKKVARKLLRLNR